jgi:CRP-like cAMP-binding protein
MPKEEFKNQLLRRLSVRDRAMLGSLERIDLRLRQSLETADADIDFVYFIDEGFASVVADAAGNDPIEIGLIGSEGMTGSALLLGDTRSPFDTFIQGEGNAHRIDAAQLRNAFAASPAMRAILLRYLRSFLTQVASTAASNGRASISERLGRWLLMVEDRLGSTFPITHEFLGIMLAVQRPGVTLALQSLEGAGLIHTTRGSVEIIDRTALIASTKGAYGVAEREYLRLFP